MAKYKRVAKYISPDEAGRIASEFRNKANQMRSLYSSLSSTNSKLDSTWEGKSKNRFSANYSPQLSNIQNYAMWLEEKANQIESIRVKIWEKVRIKD